MHIYNTIIIINFKSKNLKSHAKFVHFQREFISFILKLLPFKFLSTFSKLFQSSIDLTVKVQPHSAELLYIGQPTVYQQCISVAYSEHTVQELALLHIYLSFNFACFSSIAWAFIC